MKRIIVLAFIVLGMVSCEKDEVSPSGYNTPRVNKTNVVKITVNSYEIGDNIDITCGVHGAYGMYYSHSIKPYFLCNILNNLGGTTYTGDCSGNEIIITGYDIVNVVYEGDMTIEYLPSTL